MLNFGLNCYLCDYYSAPEIADVGKAEAVVVRQDAVDSMLEPHIMRRAFLNKVSDSNADVDPKTLGSMK